MILKFCLFDTLNPKEQENYNAIIAQWYQSEWGKFRPDKKQLQDWTLKPSSLSAFPLTVLALDEAWFTSKLIGVVRLKYDDVEGLFPGQNRYRLSGLYVEPHYRKQGVGVKLIETALKMAHQRGAEEVWLFTHSSEAKEYYLKQGWVLTQEKELYGNLAWIFSIHVKAFLTRLEHPAALNSPRDPTNSVSFKSS